jgi:hypothetical protein
MRHARGRNLSGSLVTAYPHAGDARPLYIIFFGRVFGLDRVVKRRQRLAPNWPAALPIGYASDTDRKQLPFGAAAFRA